MDGVLLAKAWKKMPVAWLGLAYAHEICPSFHFRPPNAAGKNTLPQLG